MTTVVSEDSCGVVAVAGPQQAVTTTEPRQPVAAVEAQEAATIAEPWQLPTAAQPQQAAMAVAATTVEAVAAPSILPAPAVAGGSQAVVMEIPDDDVPPPGWDQWASPAASAPEASAGALVVKGGGGAVLGRPTDGTGASSSRIGPSARPEQEQEHADAPPAHFVEAQAEQGLWQELRDHSASLNRALNEALQIHSGPTWRVFQVSWVPSSFAVLSPALFAFVFFLMPVLLTSLVGGRS
jgi:hypothetical protein